VGVRVRVVAVLANDQVMDQPHELHLLAEQVLEHAIVIVVILQVLEMLVSLNEALVGQLGLKVNSKRFDSVAHRV